MARKGSVQSQHGDGVGRKESMRSRKSAATESEVGIVAVALFRSGEEACILLLTLLAVFCSQIESDDLDSLVSDAESEVSIARKQSVKNSQVPLLCLFFSLCFFRPVFACFSVGHALRVASLRLQAASAGGPQDAAPSRSESVRSHKSSQHSHVCHSQTFFFPFPPRCPFPFFLFC